MSAQLLVGSDAQGLIGTQKTERRRGHHALASLMSRGDAASDPFCAYHVKSFFFLPVRFLTVYLRLPCPWTMEEVKVKCGCF